MKNVFISLLLVISITFSITIDSELSKHSIYAITKITTNSGCKTPTGGVVGTPGEFSNSGNLVYIQTKTNARNISGNDWRIDAGDTLSYVNFIGTLISNTFSLSGDADTNNVASVYSTPPTFPDLSSISFTGNTNIITPGNYLPGQYKDLVPDWSVSSGNPIYLKAGIYYFDNINISSSRVVIIIPDDEASYKTEIYVKQSIIFSSGAQLKVEDTSGYGKVVLCQVSSNPIFFNSTSEVTAALIAKNAPITFNDQSKLIGQVFANEINLIGFNGGEGLLFDEIKQKSIRIVSDTLNCVESGSVSNSPNVIFE